MFDDPLENLYGSCQRIGSEGLLSGYNQQIESSKFVKKKTKHTIGYFEVKFRKLFNIDHKKADKLYKLYVKPVRKVKSGKCYTSNGFLVVPLTLRPQEQWTQVYHTANDFYARVGRSLVPKDVQERVDMLIGSKRLNEILGKSK